MPRRETITMADAAAWLAGLGGRLPPSATGLEEEAAVIVSGMIASGAVGEPIAEPPPDTRIDRDRFRRAAGRYIAAWHAPVDGDCPVASLPWPDPVLRRLVEAVEPAAVRPFTVSAGGVDLTFRRDRFGRWITIASVSAAAELVEAGPDRFTIAAMIPPALVLHDDLAAFQWLVPRLLEAQDAGGRRPTQAELRAQALATFPRLSAEGFDRAWRAALDHRGVDEGWRRGRPHQPRARRSSRRA